MGFRQADSEGRGGFARIWSIEDKGNYSIAKISTSRKRKDGEGYETDFQDGFVRLIGSAHTKAQELNITEKGVTIQITSCEVTTPYNAETKRGYTNYAIFAFDVPEDNDSAGNASAGSKKSTKTTSKAKAKTKTKSKAEPVEAEVDDEELPF